jgi:nicotinamidase-related amidase
MSGRALLVIDMQNRYTQPGAPFEIEGAPTIIEGINELAGNVRAAGDAVVWIHRVVRPRVGPGRRTSRRYGAAGLSTFVGFNAELDPRLDIADEDLVVSKPRQSAYFGSDLDSSLRNLDVSTVVLVGFTTNVCCLGTAQDAAARDYDVVMVEDLCAALPIRAADPRLAMDAEEVHRASLAFVTHSIGDVVDAESAARMFT